MVLDFDPPKYGSDPTSVLLEEKRKKYSTWVNQVFKSHEGALIEALLINFDLDNTCKPDLDRWIEYAVQKNATVLHVDLHPGLYGDHNHGLNLYTFPKQVLSYSSIKVLRYLRLCYVDVSGPVLENILSICPHLGLLGVVASSTLLSLKVCDASSPNLKCLELRFCNNMKYLEISARNLVKFTYYGQTSPLQLHHAQKLVTLSIGGRYCMHEIPFSSELSPCFPFIQNLLLDYKLGVDWEINPPHEFPAFNVVKLLYMRVLIKDEDSLLPFMSLIKKCPMLHTLQVEFEWNSGERSSRKVEERRGEELKCLKVFEFVRFKGHTADIELVISILENAPYLEKVIFDPWDSISERVRDPTLEAKVVPIWDLILDEKRRAARECAALLAKKYSPNAKLVLL